MKIRKGILALSLLAIFAMTGCEGVAPEAGESQESSQGGKTSQPTSEPFVNDPLPFDADQIAQNVLALGMQTGFELVCEAKASGAEAAEEFTVGVKGNTAWGFYQDSAGAVVLNLDGTATGYYKTEANQEYYEKNEIDESILKGATPREYYEKYAGTISDSIYYANNYFDMLKVKRGEDKEFLGRQVAEYNFSRRGSESIDFKAYIDLQLGITLYWSGQLTNGENTTGGSFEVKSFKTGAEVTVPEFPTAPEA